MSMMIVAAGGCSPHRAGRQKRSLYGGQFSPKPDDPPPVTSSPEPFDSRMVLVKSQMTEPWKRLLERADAAKKMQEATSDPATPSEDKPLVKGDPLTNDAYEKSVKTTREQIQTISWYILLDFAKFLQKYLPNVWQAVNQQALPVPLTTEESAVFDALSNTRIDAALVDDLTSDTVYIESPPKTVTALYQTSDVARTLSAALKAVMAADTSPTAEERLESATISYDREKPDAAQPAKPDPTWPAFLFPLADSVRPVPLPAAPLGVIDDSFKLADQLARVAGLTELIKKALPPQTAKSLSMPLHAQPVMDPRGALVRDSLRVRAARLWPIGSASLE